MYFEKPFVYAAKHDDLDIRISSQSGGAFSAIADTFLESRGVVYGCVLDGQFRAVHIRADNVSDKNRMKGSKYVQSDLLDTFRMIREDLDNQRKVLFSGTSCQVAGLRAYLGKDYESLLCVDIVCYGVPSPGLFREYIEWQEKKNNSKIAEYIFRDKKTFGWKSNVETISFENGKTINCRVFATLFSGKLALRPSCYKCPYKSILHPGDITIADYWGIEKVAPDFMDDKGVSLMLVNTRKGKECFDSIIDNISYIETSTDDCLQPCLINPYPEPKDRTRFWKDHGKMSFGRFAARYSEYGRTFMLKKKLKSRIDSVKRRILKIARKA